MMPSTRCSRTPANHNNTMEKKYYLKPNVVIEPLIDRWYAWAHLVSPATAAMNITGRHLPIINSFIQSPQIHEAAVRNPKMLGGPFMDISADDVDKVQQLKEQTEDRRAHMVRFSEAVKELTKMLSEKAKGYSLEELYKEVPDQLRGFVELVYDLNGNANFRLFESLLYESEYYNERSQSIALWVTQNDHRPFVLSTPRIDSSEVLHLQTPFRSELIDLLSEMKRVPRSKEELLDHVDLNEHEQLLLEDMLTEDKPNAYAKYEGNHVRMRYFGHACVLIETKEISILVDPLVSYYGYQSDVSRFSDMDLPDVIDYILITHNHQDHVLFETLLPLRHKCKNIVVPRSNVGNLQDPSLKLMFEKLGFQNIIEMNELEFVQKEDCSIHAIPFLGEHCDLNIQTKLCYKIQIRNFSILFAADSCNIEPTLYERVRVLTGPVDVVMLGMECDGAPLSWVYGALLTEELPREKDLTRRLAGSNFERGYQLVESFDPSEVYVYAMGQEPWLEFISSIKYTSESNPIIQSDQLIEKCKAENRWAERLFGEKELLYDLYPAEEEIPVLA